AVKPISVPAGGAVIDPTTGQPIFQAPFRPPPAQQPRPDYSAAVNAASQQMATFENEIKAIDARMATADDKTKAELNKRRAELVNNLIGLNSQLEEIRQQALNPQGVNQPFTPPPAPYTGPGSIASG